MRSFLPLPLFWIFFSLSLSLDLQFLAPYPISPISTKFILDQSHNSRNNLEFVTKWHQSSRSLEFATQSWQRAQDFAPSKSKSGNKKSSCRKWLNPYTLPNLNTSKSGKTWRWSLKRTTGGWKACYQEWSRTSLKCLSRNSMICYWSWTLAGNKQTRGVAEWSTSCHSYQLHQLIRD